MKQNHYNLRDFIKHNGLFYSLYLIAILVTSVAVLNYDKVPLHAILNKCVGSPYVDAFYKYFTHLGDGVFAVILGVLILITNIRNGLYILLAYSLAGASASIIKWSVNYTRPYHTFKYYYREIHLNYVEGVDLLGERSFPSGHSTAAFSVFTALALITTNKFLKVLFFIIAINAAFSRTYLSQHWLVDIMAGSIIGITFATILYFVFYTNKSIVNKFNRPLFKK